MLVDVTFKLPEDRIAGVLKAIAGSDDILPRRISQGLYLSNHWNSVDFMDQEVKLVDWWKRWSDEWQKCHDNPGRRFDHSVEPQYQEYGVCDTPDQVVKKFKLDSLPQKVFVTFVKITKADQPKSGGWRWHKWGSYIGKKRPKCEYIADEPNITEVYTFHIYELKE